MNQRTCTVSRGILCLILVVVLYNTSFSVFGKTFPVEETKNILVIHTYHQGLSMTDVYNDEIGEAFLRIPNYRTSIFTEYMDVMRIDYKDGNQNFGRYLEAKYEHVQFDGVVCVGREAYEFVNGHYYEYFDETAVVQMDVDDEVSIQAVSENIVGITKEIPFAGLFAQITALKPDVKKINIYTSSKTLVSKYEEILKKVSDTYGVLYQVYSETDVEAYTNDLLVGNPREAIILLSSLYDDEGTIYTLDYLFDRIDLEGDAMVMSIEDYYVGKGAVGSVQYDHKEYVMTSVKLLSDLLEGQPMPESLTSGELLKTVTMIDYKKVLKLELDEAGIDESVSLLNKPSVAEVIQKNSLEFIIIALIIITVILIFSVTNLLLRLKAEKDREDVRRDLQLSYMELEAAHEQLVASESELTRQFRELQQKEDELRKSRERYRLAAKGSEFGIWDFDMDTGKMYFSNKGKEILGLPFFKESFGMDEFYGLFDVKQELDFRRIVDEHLKQERNVVEYEAQIEIDGVMEWVSIRGKALFNDANEATRLAGSLTNITQEKEADERLIQIAFNDELTGLSNKAYFNSMLQRVCMDGACENAALMLLDLDNFKTINDSMGHNYGDEVLKKVAEIIKNELGEHHELIRFGGDEFIVLIKNYTDKGIVDELAINLITTFRNKYDIDGIGFSNTLSMGIALYPEDSDDIDKLLKHADLALNEAKANGRNQYVHYDADIEAAMNHNLWYERELQNAINEEQFELYYQPKFHIETDRIMGYEALIRWHHPEEGIISPAEFIPIAEENGMIIRIGEWVIEEAINQLELWHRQGNDHLTMSINLSAKQFKEVKLQDLVRRAMFGKVVKTKHIEFEITETTALHDIDSAILILDDFRLQGYKIALDDFGTGYSSLNYLSELPIDTLKIDKTFISNSMVSSSGEQIIKTVIQLAHAHDMEVVAEGVETLEQLEFLKNEHCDVIQGYYISKPVSAEYALGLATRSLELL